MFRSRPFASFWLRPALIALLLIFAVPGASFEIVAHDHGPVAPAGSGVSAGPAVGDEAGHPCPICRLAHESAAPSIVVSAGSPGSVASHVPCSETLQIAFLPPQTGPARAPPASASC